MESIWQVALIALAAGGLIGALAYRLLSPSLTKAEQVRSELEAARQELIDYKASVNSHFDKTSELVNDLTQNYVRVYQHLAEGAQTLGGSRELNKLLDQRSGKVLLTVDRDAAAEKPQPAARTVESYPAPDDTAAAAGAGDTAADSGASVAESSADDAGAADRAEPVTAAAASVAEDTGGGGDAANEERKGDARSAAASAGESGDPRIDVTKIERRAGDTESELGTLIPESGKDPEIKPTRH